MKVTVHMEIGASLLVASLRPAAPGWASNLVHNMSRKLQQRRKPAKGAAAAPLPAKEPRIDIAAEVAGWTPGASRAENITALLDAAAQALRALHARHAASLDGCRLIVRAGASVSYLGITPMDFSSPSMRSRQQLDVVAKALAQEAIGAEAATHEVRWSVQTDQAHLCVVTLDSALIAGLHALAQAQRMKLASCQPAFVELLDSELEKSRRQRDTRTLVLTERETPQGRQATVTFVRVVNGSAVNAWRTGTPNSSASADHWLQPMLHRFLIASGAASDEQVIPCVWPDLDLPPAAATELSA